MRNDPSALSALSHTVPSPTPCPASFPQSHLRERERLLVKADKRHQDMVRCEGSWEAASKSVTKSCLGKVRGGSTLPRLALCALSIIPIAIITSQLGTLATDPAGSAMPSLPSPYYPPTSRIPGPPVSLGLSYPWAWGRGLHVLSVSVILCSPLPTVTLLAAGSTVAALSPRGPPHPSRPGLALLRRPWGAEAELGAGLQRRWAR